MGFAEEITIIITMITVANDDYDDDGSTVGRVIITISVNYKLLSEVYNETKGKLRFLRGFFARKYAQCETHNHHHGGNKVL
jgi:hypothetical protein